jgi:hypothetical protein
MRSFSAKKMTEDFSKQKMKMSLAKKRESQGLLSFQGITSFYLNYNGKIIRCILQMYKILLNLPPIDCKNNKMLP